MPVASALERLLEFGISLGNTVRPHFKTNPLSDFYRKARNKILSLPVLALVNDSDNVEFLSILGN